MTIMRYVRHGIDFADTRHTLSFRTNGPCEIQTDGDVFFSQLTAKSHNRIQGPSRIYADGTVQFTDIAGNFHCTSRPAVTLPSGDRQYWVNGRKLTPTEFFLQYGVM